MTDGGWYLEGFLYQSERMHRVVIDQDAFTVGRSDDCSLTLKRYDVSRQHCLLTVKGGRLFVSDNGSTNGTHINGMLLSSEQELLHGDILKIASLELRVIRNRRQTPEWTATQVALEPAGQTGLISGIRQLEEMIEHRSVTAHYHAIVTPRGTVVGHEALGRGTANDLPSAPWPLFQIADSAGMSVPLSELFRDVATQRYSAFEGIGSLYVNSHPSEMTQPDKLLDKLRSLRQQYPTLPLNLEIHEDSVADPLLLRDFQSGLTLLDIGLVYDDFGAGRARLLEMVEVPPAVVKFDISLIRGIDSAPKTKHDMVAALLKMVSDVGSQTLAEGIETVSEYRVCADLGFDLMQGYWFGKPEATPRAHIEGASAGAIQSMSDHNVE